MSAAFEQVERQALALSAEERAQLVDRLQESLGEAPPFGLSEAWKTEIERRRQAILSGKTRPVSGEEVTRKAWALANPA